MAWDDDNSGPMPPPTGKPVPRVPRDQPDYKDPPPPRPTLEEMRAQSQKDEACSFCGCTDKRRIRFNLSLLLLPPSDVSQIPRNEWRCRNCGRPVSPPVHPR